MTSLPPEDADPTKRERSAAEVDAEFAMIISGISHQMRWDTQAQPGPDGSAHPDPVGEPGRLDGQESADERERRRALRRAQRAEEVALFEAGQAETEAEMQADNAHFVPPDPPPVPRPKRRTVVALLFMAIGLALLIAPGVLQVATNVVLVLAIISLVGGFGMLVHGLRPHSGDPGDAAGWDDGARL